MGRVLIDENFLIANKGNKQKIKRGKKRVSLYVKMKKISTGEIFINKYNENDIPYIERNRKNKKKTKKSTFLYI